MAGILFAAVSEPDMISRLHQDLPTVILGSIIAAIGLSAIFVRILRWRSREPLLLWFGLFAGPYGIRLLTNSFTFHLALGESSTLLQIGGRFLDFVTIVPALLLFEYFYGKGWRSSVHWLIGLYVAFATTAFVVIAFERRPDLFPAAGIGTVFLLPLVLLIGRLLRYHPPRVAGQAILLWGLLALFLTFAYDRVASARWGEWRVEAEPYGVFILICCLGYVATRRVLANERQLASLDEEMRAARQIQASILPRAMPQTYGLDIAVRYSPMKAVAGDFYDFLAVQPGGLGILVADVAGHGVPAALVASMVKVAVSLQMSDGAHPAKVIAALNAILCREAQGQYASAVYVFIDEAKRIVRYSAAGHPPPLLWRSATENSAPLNADGLLLGVRPEEKYSQLEFSMQAGDRLLLYTDGLTEATNAAGLDFGEVRLKDFIHAHVALSAELFAERLLREVLAWPGAGTSQAQSDDITFVVVDIGQKL